MNPEKVELSKLRKALAEGEDLSDAQVVLLAKVRRAANSDRVIVRVEKVALRPGEELWDFVSALETAVQTNRVILADGSLDAWLVGIYEDHVIVRDGNTGKTFASQFSRDASGEFSFSAPVEVRSIWVPVSGDVSFTLAKSASAAEWVEVKRETSPWSGVLPSTLLGR